MQDGPRSFIKKPLNPVCLVFTCEPDVVDAINGEHGEGPGGIRAGKQDAFFEGGNTWLDAHFPALDFIRRVLIVAR